MTLDGIDISKWQPTTPPLAGQSFAFARATYATTVDPKYAMHVANFRRAGLVVGAYHFGVGFVSVPAQVKAFLTASKGADLLILDLERDSTKTMTQAEARAFIKAVQATGKKIGLYHSRSGFPSLGQDYNWIAQWRAAPPTGIAWAFWQWQGSPLDRDKFNGDKAALLKLAGKVPAPPKEAPVADPNVRLLDAIITRAGYGKNEVESADNAGLAAQVGKIVEFAGRILTSLVPTALVADEPADGPAVDKGLVLTNLPFNPTGPDVAVYTGPFPVFSGTGDPNLLPDAVLASFPVEEKLGDKPGAYGDGLDTLDAWYRYQLGRAHAAAAGIIVNDPHVARSMSPAQYLRDVIYGGNGRLSFYGPTAGVPQKAEEAAALAAAVKALGS